MLRSPESDWDHYAAGLDSGPSPLVWCVGCLDWQPRATARRPHRDSVHHLCADCRESGVTVCRDCDCVTCRCKELGL